MSETRKFYAPHLNIDSLINALKDWYSSQKYTVQTLDVHGGGVLIQAKRGGWRNAVGMSSALNVELCQQDTNLTVKIGAGKWADKAIVGTVSMFVLWPLAVTSAWGAWKQSQLPKRTFEFIQQFVDEFTSADISNYSEEDSPYSVKEVT
ncbi:MAG: hypothetical protein WBM44_25045 [Waterburya sp.]